MLAWTTHLSLICYTKTNSSKSNTFGFESSSKKHAQQSWPSQWKLVSKYATNKITQAIKSHSVKLIKSNLFLLMSEAHTKCIFSSHLHIKYWHHSCKYFETLRCKLQDQKKSCLHFKPGKGCSDSCWLLCNANSISQSNYIYYYCHSVNKASKQVLCSGNVSQVSTTGLWNSEMWLVDGEG